MADFYKVFMKRSLRLMDNTLSKQDYLCTSDKPTIADLSAVCELGQTAVLDFDLSEYPAVNKWRDRLFSEVKSLSEWHKEWY